MLLLYCYQIRPNLYVGIIISYIDCEKKKFPDRSVSLDIQAYRPERGGEKSRYKNELKRGNGRCDLNGQKIGR